MADQPNDADINALDVTDAEAAEINSIANPLVADPAPDANDDLVRIDATTDGVVAQKDAIAATDSPLVAHLRNAGAIIVGRSNTPAFSLRWFTDNDLHGRATQFAAFEFDSKIEPVAHIFTQIATRTGQSGDHADFGWLLCLHRTRCEQSQSQS